METGKFYTPSIEEFYVGFEYEIGILEIDAVNLKQGKTVGDYIKNIELGILNAPYKLSWHKSIFEQYDIFDITSSLIVKNRIRVKYLDKDDIEEYGFKHDPNEDQEETPCQFDIHGYSSGYILDHQDTELKTAYIMYHFPDNFVIIESIVNCGSGKENMLFRGTIKNKSELEQVLKMVIIK